METRSRPVDKYLSIDVERYFLATIRRDFWSIGGLLSSITRVCVGGSSVDRATEAINGGRTIENVPWDKISRPGIRANHLLILMRVNIILLRDKRDISRGRENSAIPLTKVEEYRASDVNRFDGLVDDSMLAIV